MALPPRQASSSPPPSGFPADAPITRVILFSNPTSLTVTILPWPTGIVLPADSKVASTPVTFSPGQTGSWTGHSIVVNHDGMHLTAGGTTYSITTGAFPQTSPFSSSDSAVSTSSVPSGPTSGQATSASSPTSASASTTTIPGDGERQSGLGGGAVAGMAIGCLVAGALIASLVLWLCWGRRRASRHRHSEASAMALMPPDKGALTHTKSLGGGSPPYPSAGTALPQPLEDQAICGEISKIGNLIKNHVQSYYHNRSVNPGLTDLDDIIALGQNLPISTRTISILLDNTTTREVALRFCIAFAIITRLQNYGYSLESLLPPELCSLMRHIFDTKYESKTHAMKAAHWRAATAELMRSTYVQDAFTSSDARNGAIHSLMKVLENILQPFADSAMNNEERKRNLEEILKRSAIFAFTLFSQPSSWEFDWKEEQGVKSDEFCIFPALVQVTNEAGESIRPPRSFSEAVVRRLEG